MKSIRKQLTLSLLIGFGLLLASGTAALYLSTRQILLRDFDALLLTKARGLASLTEIHDGKVTFDFEEELLPEFAGKQREAFFEMWLPDGRVLARSRSLNGRDLSPPPANTGITTPLFWNLDLQQGEPGRAVTLTFFPPEDDEHAAGKDLSRLVTVTVALDRGYLDAHLHVFAIGAAIASILMMSGGAFLAAFSVRRALSSLSELGQRVAAVDAMTLASRFDCEHLPYELSPICKRLNDLLARLDAAFARERRFSEDVAHELRTPVAELRALAQLSLTSKNEDEPDIAVFRDALAIAEHMEEITNGLLAIARCESGRQIIDREPVFLLPLLHDLWRPHATRADERSLKVTVSILPGLCALSDRALLRTVISNLFANAAAYAPIGSTVGITATREGAFARLTVSNPPGELTQSDLPRLFERFWRKDPARTGSGHAGLGLSIAQAAARLLGEELHAEISDTELFTIRLTLPLAEAAEGEGTSGHSVTG